MTRIVNDKIREKYSKMVDHRTKLLSGLSSPEMTDEMRDQFLAVLGNSGLTDLMEEFLARVIETGTKVGIIGEHNTNLVTIMTGKAYSGVYDQIKSREDSPIMCAVLEVVKADTKVIREVSPNDKVHFELDKFMNGEILVVVHNMTRCFDCGQHVVHTISVVGDTVIIETISKKPECYDDVDYTFDIKFKAGEEVYFGDWVGGPDSPCSISLNDAKGLHDHTMFYAEHDIGYIFTGNSCPSLWINDEKTNIIIGTPADWRDDDWEIIPEKTAGYTKLGSICTDLWACCFSTERVISKFEDNQLDRGEPLIKLDKDTTFRVTVNVNRVPTFGSIELI
ncbi:MAG: hypothetical protein ACRC9Y_11035 [Aeromonas veronii]